MPLRHMSSGRLFLLPVLEYVAGNFQSGMNPGAFEHDLAGAAGKRNIYTGIDAFMNLPFHEAFLRGFKYTTGHILDCGMQGIIMVSYLYFQTSRLFCQIGYFGPCIGGKPVERVIVLEEGDEARKMSSQTWDFGK